MTIVLFYVVLIVVGLVMHFWSKNPKVNEVGRILFFCALLALLMGANPHIPRISVT